MNTYIKWLSSIIVLDVDSGEILSIDNTQVTAEDYITKHKLEIIKKTSTVKTNENDNTARKTIYWHTRKQKDRQCKLFG